MKKYLFLIIPFSILAILVIKDIAFKNGVDLTENKTQNLIQTKQAEPSAQNENKSVLQNPIDRAGERVTKKPFGIFITKQDSPVQPERFSGFHTGTDFETNPSEQNADVPIYAMTDGEIIVKKSASGYGGVLVESAMINNESATIIYGHLDLSSINKKAGDSLTAGEQIGILGKGYSAQTDGERKHLHLGIHKGSSVNILGYVQNKNQQKDWIDPMTVL